ncbi:CoA-transferase subunit beta [Catenulispora pinisilvae]|uniref:CoA-transferase subunit beta n=1 Tax=Catenulispora pinisilvae TaxID=2705253 RepID=UPI001891A976|nr:CoA-transferase [Catenulispora pinisilvae]
MSDVTRDVTRAEICVAACAEAWRGDGEIIASPMGLIPALGARLAKMTFALGLMLSDGDADYLTDPTGTASLVEAHIPYRQLFDFVWHGSRHVMMGASQLDKFGNQNISAIGTDFARPKAQLIGVRGAPGNTVNHPTSYWIANHSPKVFVEKVDVVSGLGYDRARGVGHAARFHELRRVVTNLAVFDFQTKDNRMRIRSVHPGVSVDDVVEATGFVLVGTDNPETTPEPDDVALWLIREVLDPENTREREVPSAKRG